MTRSTTMSEAGALPSCAVSVMTEQCTGCGACVDACPTDVLRIDGSGKAVVAYPRDCHVCFLCVDDCPTSAVVVDHGVRNPRRVSIYADLPADALVFRGGS